MIRIQKARRNDKAIKNANGVVSVLTSDEQHLWRENNELISSPNKEVLEQRYVKNVIIPLLGPKHVDAGVSNIIKWSLLVLFRYLWLLGKLMIRVL